MSTPEFWKELEAGHRRPFVIAEVAQAHDGSLGIAHSFIDAVAETGADAIKFQTHFAKPRIKERTTSKKKTCGCYLSKQFFRSNRPKKK